MPAVPKLLSAVCALPFLAMISSVTQAYDAQLLLPDREHSIMECFAVASQAYRIPTEYLWAIGRVESSLNPRAQGKNKNGTRDLGVMQINTTHLPHLRKYGINETRLLDEPCLNIHVGAWVLRGNLNRYGETWEAVGAYNASERRRDLRLVYAKKVRDQLARLVEWRNSQGQQRDAQSEVHRVGSYKRAG